MRVGSNSSKMVECGSVMQICGYSVIHYTCGKFFSQKVSVSTHNKFVHEKQIFKCDLCGKILTRPFLLKAHIQRVHEGRKDYKCHICEKDFAQSRCLKSHAKLVHLGKTNSYLCDISMQ